MAVAPEGANGKKAPSLEALTRAALRARAWTVRFGGRCSGLPALALLEARASRGAPGGRVCRARGFSPGQGSPQSASSHAHARLCARAGVRRPSTPGHVPPRPRAPPRTESRRSVCSGRGGRCADSGGSPLEAPRRWVAVPSPPLAIVSVPTPQPCHRSRRPKRLLGSCLFVPGDPLTPRASPRPHARVCHRFNRL